MVVFHNCIKTEVVCIDLQLHIGFINRTGRPFHNASLSQLGEIIFHKFLAIRSKNQN